MLAILLRHRVMCYILINVFGSQIDMFNFFFFFYMLGFDHGVIYCVYECCNFCLIYEYMDCSWSQVRPSCGYDIRLDGVVVIHFSVDLCIGVHFL